MTCELQVCAGLTGLEPTLASDALAGHVALPTTQGRLRQNCSSLSLRTSFSK
jgi:hypothetical protein